MAVFHQLGLLSIHLGEYEKAAAYFDDSIVIKRESVDKREMVLTMGQQGILTFHNGDFEGAERIYHETLAVGQEMGDVDVIATTLCWLARLREEQGLMQEALIFAEQAMAIKGNISADTKRSVQLTHERISAVASSEDNDGISLS